MTKAETRWRNYKHDYHSNESHARCYNNCKCKLRHHVAATTIAEFPYGNMSIVEKIVGLAYDFLIRRLSMSNGESSTPTISS